MVVPRFKAIDPNAWMLAMKPELTGRKYAMVMDGHRVSMRQHDRKYRPYLDVRRGWSKEDNRYSNDWAMILEFMRQIKEE